MRDVRLNTTEWAVGTFCAALGALMLVEPHQFNAMVFGLFLPGLALWGIVYLAAGIGLLAIAGLGPRRVVTLAGHIIAGCALLLLAIGMAATRGYISSVIYAVLGIATVFSPIIRLRSEDYARPTDLLVLPTGISALLIGFLLFALPGQFDAPGYELLRSQLGWFGLAFLASGAALTVISFVANPHPFFFWAAHLLGGGVLLAFCITVEWPSRSLTGIAYFGGFGILIVLLPLVSSWLTRTGLASLRMRLALSLLAATALPLIAVNSIDANREEQSVSAQSLALQRDLAVALSDTINDYIGSHRSAVAALAAQPDLLTAAPAAPRRALVAFSQQYPDVRDFSIYDAKGTLLAQTGDGSSPPVQRDVLDQATQGLLPWLTVREGPIVGTSMLVLWSPVHDSQGGSSGFVLAVVETTRLHEILFRGSSAVGGDAYVIDGRGRVVATTNAASATVLTDVSSSPPAKALQRNLQMAGTLSYQSGSEAQLVGYAPVPSLGWGVVIQRSRDSALASAYAGRELTILVLVFVIGVAILIGGFVADRLVRPLRVLATAADKLALGDMGPPLPHSTVAEVHRLVRAFGALRDGIDQRTAERERAEERINFLAEASALLGTSLDYDMTLRGVATLMVPALADWCIVEVMEEQQPLRRIAVARGDPSNMEAVLNLTRALPDGSGQFGVAAILETGSSRIRSEITDADLQATAQDDEHLRLLREMRPTSAMVVPLLSQDQTLGAITFVSVESRREFSASDLTFAEDLAARCALAIDNALLYKQMQTAVHARDEFLSVAAHELKTPVTSLRGFAEVTIRAFKRHGTLDPRRVQDAFQMIVEQTTRLSGLIAQLLDVSRIDEGKLALNPMVTDMTELVERVARAARLRGDLEPIVVLAEQQLQANVDPIRIEQVVTNLLDNAIKYSGMGGEVRLDLSTTEPGIVCLRVLDHGIGISEEDRRHVFDRYFQAHADRHLGGMGLGLYISRQIVELHGGAISVEAPADGGTCFVVTLPTRLESAAGDTGEMLHEQSTTHSRR